MKPENLMRSISSLYRCINDLHNTLHRLRIKCVTPTPPYVYRADATIHTGYIALVYAGTFERETYPHSHLNPMTKHRSLFASSPSIKQLSHNYRGRAARIFRTVLEAFYLPCLTIPSKPGCRKATMDTRKRDLPPRSLS